MAFNEALSKVDENATKLYNWKTFIKCHALKGIFYAFMECSIHSRIRRLILLSALCFYYQLCWKINSKHTHTQIHKMLHTLPENILYFSSREHNTLVLSVYRAVSVTLCSHTDNYMREVNQRLPHPTFLVILFTDNYAHYCLVLHGRMHKITIDTYTIYSPTTLYVCAK